MDSRLALLATPPHLRHASHLASSGAMEHPFDGGEHPAADKIYRLVFGLDTGGPRPMPSDEANHWLCDPFAELLLKQGRFPLTLRQLLDDFEHTRERPNGLKKRSVHHIAEGGQIPWSEATAKLNRTFRLAIALDTGSSTDVFISTGFAIDSTSQFLQLMSWDPRNGVFNFYQRRAGVWVWSGNSEHALVKGTRHRGPFTGHINGGPVMKELQQPWSHWSSMNAEIGSNIFPPGSPLGTDPLFLEHEGGEHFEMLFRSATQRWNEARLQHAILGNKISLPYSLMRQLLNTTTVNLISSPMESRTVTSSNSLSLPTTFFINSFAIGAIFAAAGGDLSLETLSAPGQFYLDSLSRYEFALVDKDFTQPGDTFFAFLVPEPAREDVDLLEQMLDQEIISPRLAACLLMVDFSNPVYSGRRKQLLPYTPKEIVMGEKGRNLDQNFVANVLASQRHEEAGSAEAEFMSNWAIPEDAWVAQFQQRIAEYWSTLQKVLSTPEGFDNIVRLAESRRAEFRKSALFEFPLSLPTTLLRSDQFPLILLSDGTVKKING